LNDNYYFHFGYIFGASSSSDQNSYIPSSLKTVVITGGTSIGDSAFYGCTGLTSVTIPSSITTIQYESFRGCTGLTSITIPSSVTSIGYYVFSGCSGLTSVTFQGTITSDNFNDRAFGDLYNEGYIGDLRDKYLSGGAGTYTRSPGSEEWTKQQ